MKLACPPLVGRPTGTGDNTASDQVIGSEVIIKSPFTPFIKACLPARQGGRRVLEYREYKNSSPLCHRHSFGGEACLLSGRGDKPQWNWGIE